MIQDKIDLFYLILAMNVILRNGGVTRKLNKVVKTGKLIWYEHIQRLADSGLPKQMLEWMPPRRRKRRRLRV